MVDVVSDAQAGNITDLLIGVMMLKAEPHYFLLVPRQLFYEFHQARNALLAFQFVERGQPFTALLLVFLGLYIDVAVFIF